MTNHCTPEQSLALKGVGFDMPIKDNYREKQVVTSINAKDWNDAPWGLSAPTRSEVLQWAREKKGMFGSIRMLTDGIAADWGFVIEENPYGYYLYDSIEHGRIYPTHPEAESALIDKIIEILKGKKA